MDTDWKKNNRRQTYMNAGVNEEPDLQRKTNSKLLMKAETEKLIGFAFEDPQFFKSVFIRAHPWLKQFPEPLCSR